VAIHSKSISSALVSSSEENQLHSQYSSELSSNVAAPPSSLFTVDTWAGDGVVGTRDGNGKDCSINWPYEIKFDASGNGFFTAYGSASVRKITPNGKVTTISDRLSTGETFHCVRGLALDKKGNIYVADTGNNAIRKINAETGICETIVTDTVLSSPYGITVADDGVIYISDTYSDRILSIQPEDGHCQVVAGSVNGYTDGIGKTEAKFNLPQGLIMDPAGNLIVADSKNNAIRKIDLKKDGHVTTVATGFQSPYGVAIDKRGNIFVSDYGNSAIQVIDLSGNVRPVAGELYSNYSDYPKSLKMPTGIDIDSYGNIVICDCYNHIIRRVNCVFVQMADVWPKSHRYLPREVSRATEELHCILTKSPPVPLPKELVLIMVKNLIEVWPFP
jgi:sugar lactone lactonase YvrE